MSGLETAIRNALDRSERSDVETRARIYRSAYQALEAGLKKQGIVEPDVVQRQRERLDSIVRLIEAEEVRRASADVAANMPAVLSVDPVHMAADRRSPDIAAPDIRDAPSPVDGRSIRQRSIEEPGSAGVDDSLGGFRPGRDLGAPQASAPAGPIDERHFASARELQPASSPLAADARLRPRRKGRLRRMLTTLLLLACVFGGAVWWADRNGLLLSAGGGSAATVASGDASAPEGLQTLGSDSGFSADWIDIFSPPDIGSISTRGDAEADPVSDEGGARRHLVASGPDGTSAVLVEVPVDVLAQLSGKSSTVALTVRAGTPKSTEFAVDCDFGALGECDRHRFTVNDEKVDMLFNVTFDRSLSPSAPGHILIRTDVRGGADSIDLYAVRVLPGR